MKFYTIFLFLLTQFNCALCEERHIKNVQLFNDFVKNLLKIHHQQQESIINVNEAAMLLESVQIKIAEKIHGNAEIDINHVFSNVEAICHNQVEEMKMLEMFQTQTDKVQFLMLLISFAIRLAFTIGSELVQQGHSPFSMHPFVVAYKQLESKFPVDEHLKDAEYKFRYFQGAFMEVDLKLSAISITFIPATESEEKQRKFNYDTIHFYMSQWKVERVLPLLENLKKYSKANEGERYIMESYGRRNEFIEFLDRFMLNSNGTPVHENGKHFYEFNQHSLFVMKNFAANLAKLMLRMKKDSKEAELYFDKYPHIEFELKRTLAELNDYLEINSSKIFENEHDKMAKNEFLLHYEDAIQISWRTKEDFISLKAGIDAKLQEWKETFTKSVEMKKIHEVTHIMLEDLESNRRFIENEHINIKSWLLSISVRENFDKEIVKRTIEEFDSEKSPTSIDDWKETLTEYSMNSKKRYEIGVKKIVEEIEQNKKDLESLFIHGEHHNELTLSWWIKQLFKGTLIKEDSVTDAMDRLIKNVPPSIGEFEKFSKEEQVINFLFNQFIKIILGIPENEYQKATLSIEKCAKFLQIVQKSIAEKIGQNVEATTIENILNEIFIEFIKFHENTHLEGFEQNLKKRLEKGENKIQFLMLLLSFATRLAFTIGSEHLEKHGFHLSMGSFVFAHKHLQNNFPMAAEDAEEEYKFRYYQAALLHLIIGNIDNTNSSGIQIDFKMLNDEKQKRQKENFDTIYNFLIEPKRVKKLFEEELKDYLIRRSAIFGYDSLSDEQLSGVIYAFHKFLLNNYPSKDHHIHDFFITHKKENVFLMHNFALNLIKRMLRMMNSDDKKNNGNLDQNELIDVVNKVEKRVEEQRKEIMHMSYLIENELLMHYEDAIQIDWSTDEERAIRMRSLYAGWAQIIKNCKIGKFSASVTNCELDKLQNEMEEKENKELIESFGLHAVLNAILQKLRTCKQYERGHDKYSGKNVKKILTDWKKNERESNEFLQFKEKMEEIIEETLRVA